jgi:hypothetical protein
MGYWPPAVATLLFFGVFLLVISLNMEDNPGQVIVMLLILAYLLQFGSRFWFNSRFVTIDTVNRTIKFTHFFTRQKVTFHFKDIEGYVEVIQSAFFQRPLIRTDFRKIYLVQDKRFVNDFPIFTYSNYDEMKEALRHVK